METLEIRTPHVVQRVHTPADLEAAGYGPAPTIALWCRTRRLRAFKSPGGRRWLIPDSELERLHGVRTE